MPVTVLSATILGLIRNTKFGLFAKLKHPCRDRPCRLEQFSPTLKSRLTICYPDASGAQVGRDLAPMPPFSFPIADFLGNI